MSISKEVNIDVLNEVYALSAFHGLRGSHPDDQWNQQMTEEAEGFLPNSDFNDPTSHDEINNHIKSNPILEAMQRATGNEVDKNHNGNSTEHDVGSLNKSTDDLTKITE